MADEAEILRLMKEEVRASGRFGVIRGLDGDKKKAADAISIESETGADAQRVYGDYDNYTYGRKSELGQNLVEGDAKLLKYIESNPLASTVSKDDWGALSLFSLAAKSLTSDSYFMKGLVTGLTKDNPELFGEFVEGMSYQVPEFMRPTALGWSKSIKDLSAAIQPQGYERTTGSMWDITGVGDAYSWGMESLGGVIASILPSLAVGGVTALAGGAAGAPFAGVGAGPGAVIGFGTGVVGTSYAMGYGEVFKALKDENMDPELAAPLAAKAAVLIAGLDAASLGTIAGRAATEPFKRELIRVVAKRIAKEVAIGAGSEGITETLQEIIKDAAVTIGTGKEFGTKEQVKGWIESGVVGGLGGGTIAGGLHTGKAVLADREIKKIIDQTTKIVEVSEAWLKTGQAPPLGINPFIDQMIGMDSTRRLEILDTIVENANKTETKELSPELWQKLSSIVFEDQHILVTWDAVKAMYGEGKPEPGDKLLGDIPDIARQFENSHLTGAAIKIKLSDWVSVEQEVNKTLHDYVKFPEGMSLKEIQEQPTLAQLGTLPEIPETAVPSLPQELDKPYSLSKGTEGRYDVIDENGVRAAGVRVIEREGGKNLHITWEEGQIDIAGVRTMLKQLKLEYPNAETVTTPNVPGTDTLRRALEGGTINVELPFRPKEALVDVIRKSAGLEPLFDLPREGPRAVRLLLGRHGGPRPIMGVRGFTIVDELGNHVADLELSPRNGGKELHIDWLGSGRDLQGREKQDLKNKFGPKLIRSLINELQNYFPEAEKITGDRITGVREGKPRVGDTSISMEKLVEEASKVPAGWDVAETSGQETSRLIDLTEGWIHFTDEIIGQRNREWTPEEIGLQNRITKMLNKVIGKERVQVEAVEDLALTTDTRRRSGFFTMFEERKPLLMWALSAEDPFGTAKHEALHFLRNYGFITKDEWAVLEKYVKDNNLIEHYGIPSRYADEKVWVEEAVAEAFKEYNRGPTPSHWGGKVFARIKEILDNIKSFYREMLGREPTAADIFGDIERGRTGRRVGTEPLLEGAHRDTMMMDMPKETVEPAPIEPEGVPTFEPGAIMPKVRYAQYQRLMNKMSQEDKEKELQDAAREIRRREGPTWKRQFDEMVSEVSQEITNRPDWKVSQFFRNGMFFGLESKYRPKLDPKYLTPEQKKSFPKQWLTKGGMDPDKIAGSFGYSTGEYMIDKMIAFEEAKGDLGPQQFFEQQVKAEANQRMELKHGNLAENVLKEAMDHVIGTTQMDLLHEEMVALAMKAGQAVPLSLDDIRRNQVTQFHSETARFTTMRGYMKDLYRAGKAAEKAFLQGDIVKAFQEKQAQVHAFALAELAKKFEKTQSKFDDIVKEFHKRDIDVRRIPPEYTEWIHTILFQIGRPPQRMPEDLARHIVTRDHQNLKDFVDSKNSIIIGNEEYEVETNPLLVVWDELMKVGPDGAPVWKKDFKELTVGEVKALNDSLQSLKKIGMDEGKYIARGIAANTKDLVKNMGNQMSKMGDKARVKEGGWKELFQSGYGGLLQLEAVFDRWDRGNQKGIFTRMFSMPLSSASNEYSAKQREYATKLVAIDKKYGFKWLELNKAVENDVFYDPYWMEQDEKGKWHIPAEAKHWMTMTRQNVRGVLLNWGNPSNRQWLAEGYYTTPEKIQAWLDKVATKADYEWAREIGRLYEGIQRDADDMTHRMSGTFVEMLPLPKFQTIHGEYEGWYYPIIYDKARRGGPRLRETLPPPVVKRTYTGWERERSGAAGSLDISLNEVGNAISRRLKDNAFREVLHNVHKIWANKEFRMHVTKHYGEFGVKMLDKAYEDFTGQTGLTTGVAQAGNRAMETIRQNTIGVLIGYNPGTVMKHGPSAMVQSWREAGIFKQDFYVAAAALWNPITRGKNVDFMMKGAKIGDLDWQGSAELQRRHQHWAETIGGAGDIQLKRLNWREQFLYYGSYPVAWSDMLSSQVLWKAKYDKVMNEIGLTMPIEEAHTEAVQLADYAIRRTHGSTAITSRPEFMRSQNAMARNLTSLYGFFNHIFNRFYRMGWAAKDLIQDTKRGEKSFGEFMKGAGDLTGDFMMYIVAPAFIEALVVEGLMTADWDDKGWGELLGNGMLHTVSASVPGVRDVAHAVISGHDPSAGLLGASFKMATDFSRQMNFNKEVHDPGKIIQTGAAVGGMLSGLGSMQAGRWGRFMYNYVNDEDSPDDFADWYRAFRTGTTKPRKGH